MKWIIGAAVALVVLAVGASGYALLSDKDDSVRVGPQTGSVPAENKTTSIGELLANDKAAKCTYDATVSGARSTGIAYFSGSKNMYGEFTVTKDEKTNTAYVIRKDDTQYVWQKDAQTGYKADVSAFTKEKQQEFSKQFDPDKKYSFKCTSWDVEEAKFTPPTSVEFKDFSALVNQVKDGAGSLKNAAVCNAISDATAKAACLKAIQQ